MPTSTLGDDPDADLGRGRRRHSQTNRRAPPTTRRARKGRAGAVRARRARGISRGLAFATGVSGAEPGVVHDSLAQTIVHLARNASIEINVPDIKHLDASRSHLAPGKKIYISHLPKQSWSETELACRAVRGAGFDPVPHIPARLLPDAASLDRLLGALVRSAQVREVLLIAGDYPLALGYATVVVCCAAACSTAMSNAN